MTKGQRWRLAVYLTAVLIGSGLGCNPTANTNSGLVPVTTKPVKQPDNKDKPGTQPKPDVG